MAVLLVDEAAVFGTPFRLDRFPALLTEFLRRYPNTYQVEGIGQDLVDNGFDQERIPTFVRAVCVWGGYAGIAARVLNANSVETIRSAFLQATIELEADVSNIGRALSAINKVRGLGTPSFASKHLRFMAPAKCPILDAILRDFLPYSFDHAGYAKFGADCKTVASMLNEREIPNPHVTRPTEWWVADTEAALFACANGWLA